MKIWTKDEEAKRLKKRFDEASFSRAEFARNHSLKGGQAIIYQHITGRRPMSLDAAIAYAKGFGVALEEISPRLAHEAKRATDITTDDIEQQDSSLIVVSNAIGSMGLGYPQPENEQVVDTIRVAKSWVHTALPKLTSTSNLAVLTAYGDSMSPTFSDGDLLLVDRGVKTINLDAVYVIARNQELFIKRVRRRLHDGAVIIKSDNPLFGPDDVIENGDRDNLEVLGRVVWAWSGKKL